MLDPNATLDITDLLRAWGHDDDGAHGALHQHVYQELHKTARHFFQGERSNHTLQPTALVHEVYLKLVGQREDWQNRRHFFAVAARLMRRILVDHARGYQSLKRGGDQRKVPVEAALDLASPQPTGQVVAVAEALERLEAQDPLKASIVELRYFGGLTVEETAQALEKAPATIYRQWSLAKLWLFRELGTTPT